jgi:hypothetical protein
MKSFGDHRILVPGNVGMARNAKIEDAGYLGLCLWPREVVGHQAADIFRQRHSDFAGALAGLSL